VFAAPKAPSERTQSLLTSREKRRIVEDELARIRVRHNADGDTAMNPETSWRKAVWSFLNSSLGLWVLSSLVLGFITWSYTHWEEKRSRQESLFEVARKLDTEIADRIRAFDENLNEVSDVQSYIEAFETLGKPFKTRVKCNATEA
jgi:hypothetical protein